MHAKLDGKSPAEAAAAVDEVRAADKDELQSVVEDLMVDEIKERGAVLSAVASIKEEQVSKYTT